jgi:hypothetical protein
MTGKEEKENRGRGKSGTFSAPGKVFLHVTSSPLFLFLIPVLAAGVLFIIFDLSCLQSRRNVSGEVKLLYTSDVGGAIDPCG